MDNKKFGKGLSALLGDKQLSLLNNINNANLLQEIQLSCIIPNKNQPRKLFDERALSDLAESIKNYGVLQPIIVRKIKDTSNYEIISGERRFRASKIAGLLKIPAIVKEIDDESMFSVSIIENIQRENLNVVEEANAYKDLIEKYNFTQNMISEKVGKSRSHIANIMRLLSLPEKVLNYLAEGKIETCHARALIGFEFANEYIDYIVENSLTVKEIESLVKGEKVINIEKEKWNDVDELQLSINKNLQQIQETIKNKIGYNCKIAFNNKKNKGTMILNYNSLDDLDNLLKKFE